MIDVYRTAVPGIVFDRPPSSDGTPKPRGSIIDPGSVNGEDLQRMVAQGLIRKLTVRTGPSNRPVGTEREPDPEVKPVMPTKRVMHRSEVHHLSVRRSGSAEDALVRKGHFLPQDADRKQLDHLIANGYVTAVEIDY